MSVSVRDQCVGGTSKLQVTDRSVEESSVFVRHQDISASTCCGAGIPRFLLSLPTTSRPQSEINIEEELNAGYPYLMAVRAIYNEEEVSEERLKDAIRYLNTQEGGIQNHRSAAELMSALEHIESMNSRMDTSGCPQEYTYEELRHLLVEGSEYRFEDFERVLEEHCKTNGFLPSPEEFVELHHKMKGIVKLEEEVEETRQEVAERTRALEETLQEVKEKTLALERTKQQVEKTTQQAVQALQQAKEESERKDRKIQQALQRVRELEQNPEGEHQRLLSENELLKEKNNSLSALAQRVNCKICLDEEVQIFFLPCGHLVTCERCATRLYRCPMCRQNIQDKIKVLLA